MTFSNYPDPVKLGMAVGFAMAFLGIAVLGNVWLAMLVMGSLLLCAAFGSWMNNP